MFLLDSSRSKFRMVLTSINFISAQARLRQVVSAGVTQYVYFYSRHSKTVAWSYQERREGFFLILSKVRVPILEPSLGDV